MRLRLDISYDGTGFHGWATQPGLRTVQGLVEDALVTVLRLTEPSRLTCAGRTDAGVHARGQVAHVDIGVDLDFVQLHRRLSRVLPGDVRVTSVTPAPAGFDARFSALQRRYVYRLVDGRSGPDPLLRGHVTAHRHPLDVIAMNQAAPYLLGEHDFAAFCKRREGATTIRTLFDLSTTRRADGVVETTVRADAFCHSMVRSLMGALVAVGGGAYEPEWVGHILTAAMRDPRVSVMAAKGLTLEEVTYPPDGELAERARTSRAVRTL